jgi:heat-inducible transcriptional repressor
MKKLVTRKEEKSYLSEREQLILRELVEIHVNSAEPVSSRSLSRLESIGLSPASVRNSLMELEEKGLIAKPHTSAGRIPTNSGYQYYVDFLMRPGELTQFEKEKIRAVVSSVQSDTHDILESMTRVLAELTHHLGIITAPGGSELRLLRVETIPLSEKRVSLIVITTSGTAKSVLIEFPKEIDIRRLAASCTLINERLGGLTLEEIRATMSRRLADILTLRDNFLGYVKNNANAIFRFLEEESVHYSGAMNLMEQPEFRISEKLIPIFSLMEERSEVLNALAVATPQSGVITRISAFIEGVSFLSGSYRAEGGTGLICLVGPTRMNYSRTVSIISYARTSLSETFIR